MTCSLSYDNNFVCNTQHLIFSQCATTQKKQLHTCCSARSTTKKHGKPTYTNNLSKHDWVHTIEPSLRASSSVLAMARNPTLQMTILFSPVYLSRISWRWDGNTSYKGNWSKIGSPNSMDNDECKREKWGQLNHDQSNQGNDHICNKPLALTHWIILDPT